MVEIARDLRLLIRAWRPQLAAVEKFFFYRSSTTISVVQARGVLMMTLARFEIPVMEFPPMQIKLALAGPAMPRKRTCWSGDARAQARHPTAPGRRR